VSGGSRAILRITATGADGIHRTSVLISVSRRLRF
jgi:hypothetical protein